MKELQKDIVGAMKGGDKLRLQVLREAKTKLDTFKKERTLEIGGDVQITEKDKEEVFGKMAKQRKDSIDQFTKGGKTEAVDKEKVELGIISEYLPQQMTEDEVRQAVDTILKSEGINDMSGMGLAMKQFKAYHGGKADGKLVSTIVRDMLK